MALKLAEKVVEFLRQTPDTPFTAREIAEWVMAEYPNECAKKMEKSASINDEKTLLQQLVAEIGAHRSHFETPYRSHFKTQGIKTTGDRPRRYYFTESTDSEEIDAAEATETTVQPPNTVMQTPDATTHKTDFTEHDLYPKLSAFLWLELGVYSKRINEGRSSNSRGPGGNKWLHPDLAGFQPLNLQWHLEIKACAERHPSRRTRLWAFEVKKLINPSNLREAFFQTVSNSSWANFGYLVACEFRGANIREEMLILAGLHGIGFIKLNFENPIDSDIIIPASERSEVDWDTANRLTEENGDFKEYIELASDFYKTGKVRERDWDYKPSADFD